MTWGRGWWWGLVWGGGTGVSVDVVRCAVGLGVPVLCGFGIPIAAVCCVGLGSSWMWCAMGLGSPWIWCIVWVWGPRGCGALCHGFVGSPWMWCVLWVWDPLGYGVVCQGFAGSPWMWCIVPWIWGGHEFGVPMDVVCCTMGLGSPWMGMYCVGLGAPGM